ncbi:hypothetical protein [Hoeflea sp. TYP-13]|uniref:hypothetical protein n=1 Tax=Hoeflea sp. TYP-13 TaxID=3230023 RepID=UPI0034C5E440
MSRHSDKTAGLIRNWLDAVVVDLFRQFRWSFLPPLMVYFAAGISGLTAIVGAFFVKEYLGLSAAFLSGLAFWAGIPWALKMPLGHLVDLIWRWKVLLVYLGAALVAASLLIMYALITETARMSALMPIEAWYVLSALLAPSGYVVQDSVADAMSVEAVPRVDAEGQALSETRTKALHTTMQTLGRVALISGLVAVALLNIFMFSGIEMMSEIEKAAVYARIYLMALAIPVVSVSGVLLAVILKWRQRRRLRAQGRSADEIENLVDRPAEKAEANYWYFVGGLAFVLLTLAVGLSDIPFSQEIVFAGSMAIVLILMRQLIAHLALAKARALVGTAIIIFVFRAVPLPGAGATWFEIDILGFDQQFLSVLSLITSVLTLAGMIILRPLFASRTISHIVILLTVAATILALPNIGLYYGLHHWTGPLTGGVVDARFIAIMDTAVESPLGQIAMIPMLAWIAKNAPFELKATFFAVMASFTNLALSASSLLTKYLNQLFLVTREVRDRETGAITVAADYSSLGTLLIIVAAISLLAPLITIMIVQLTVLRTEE